jgi:branched-chain amino acid transport system permease protein
MEYIIHIGVFFAIYAILGVSLNLVVGYTGLISVGHAAFFGIGAYAMALATTRQDISAMLSILISIAAASVVAFFIGIVLSRFRGDYYILVSLGFNFIVFGLFMNWQDFTNGPFGIVGIPRPSIFGLTLASGISFLAFSLALLLIIYYSSRHIVRSSFGRVLKAIREDENTLAVFGYQAGHYKLAIFVISAGMAAVGGSLFAMYIRFIDPLSFTVSESVFILAIIIIGGLANLRGALLGAFILVLAPELFRFVGLPPSIAAELRQIMYGFMLVILMLYRPRGLIGEYKM